MRNGYKRVSGNSNIAFNYPLRALVISADENDSDFTPNISMELEEESFFNNWMYIRRKKD